MVVSLELQASPEREVRKETSALQVCPCPVHQAVQDPLVLRVSRVPLDLLDTPQLDKTVWLENQDVPVCREREVIQERRDRKVRRETPA